MSARAVVAIGVASLLMVLVGTATLGMTEGFSVYMVTVFAVIITGLVLTVGWRQDSGRP